MSADIERQQPKVFRSQSDSSIKPQLPNTFVFDVPLKRIVSAPTPVKKSFSGLLKRVPSFSSSHSSKSKSFLITTIPTFYCEICLENCAQTDGFHLSTCSFDHTYCKSCLEGWCKALITDGCVSLTCPGFTKCDARFNNEEAQQLLKEEDFEKYSRFQRVKGDPDFRECPQCGLGASYPPPSPLSPALPQACDPKWCVYPNVRCRGQKITTLASTLPYPPLVSSTSSPDSAHFPIDPPPSSTFISSNPNDQQKKTEEWLVSSTSIDPLPSPLELIVEEIVVDGEGERGGIEGKESNRECSVPLPLTLPPPPLPPHPSLSTSSAIIAKGLLDPSPSPPTPPVLSVPLESAMGSSTDSGITPTPGCSFIFCVDHSNAHPGVLCSEYSTQLGRRVKAEMQASESLVKRMTKPCPSCKAGTEKNGGCNHMTCQSCRANWCWICGREMKEGVSEHYSATNFLGCPGGQFSPEDPLSVLLRYLGCCSALPCQLLRPLILFFRFIPLVLCHFLVYFFAFIGAIITAVLTCVAGCAACPILGVGTVAYNQWKGKYKEYYSAKKVAKKVLEHLFVFEISLYFGMGCAGLVLGAVMLAIQLAWLPIGILGFLCLCAIGQWENGWDDAFYFICYPVYITGEILNHLPFFDS